MDVLGRRDERGAAAPLRDLPAGLNEADLASVVGEVIERLGLLALVHADDAPAHVIVDRGLLSGVPDERDDAMAPVWRDVKDMLGVAIGRAEPRCCRQQIRIVHQLREPQPNGLDEAQAVVSIARLRGATSRMKPSSAAVTVAARAQDTPSQ